MMATATLAALLFTAASPQAAEKAGPSTSPAPSAPSVTVTVLVIQASPTKGTIDPQLKSIAGKLKEVGVSFESLKLLNRLSKGGPYGQDLTFGLPEQMELAATPLEERAGVVKTRCILLRSEAGKPQKKTLLNSTITAPKGEGYTIAGPALSEGRLVLVVSAQ